MILMISIIAMNTLPSLHVIMFSLTANLHGLWSTSGSSLIVDAARTIAPLPAPSNLLRLPPSSPSDYRLVWSDDFDGDELDRRKWYPLIDCSGRGNNELQCYTSRPRNVRVRNGHLELIALTENYGGRNFTSGRVHAAGTGWTYGWFEARARVAKGMHLWPAIWLVPTDNMYGSWPRSGEIDMMETRGQNVSQFESTIHYGSSRADRGKISSSMIDFPFDFSQDFHVFGFEWTNQSMKWFLDGVQYFETSTNRPFTNKKGEKIYQKEGSPFDQNFKWILNVAVGGEYFPPSVYGRFSRSHALLWSKPSMEVDWVRVYQKHPELSRQTASPVTTDRPSSTSSATSIPASTASTHLPASSASPVTVETTTTTTDTSVPSTSSEAAPALTSQVYDEDKHENEADKKKKDRDMKDIREKEKESGRTKESETLNEKKMNEVVSDQDYDIVSSMNERENPLNNEYYDYY